MKYEKQLKLGSVINKYIFNLNPTPDIDIMTIFRAKIIHVLHSLENYHLTDTIPKKEEQWRYTGLEKEFLLS